MYLFADYHPSQCSTDFFLFVLVIILMLSRGVIVTAANYHSSPLKAESNGHITVEKRQEHIWKHTAEKSLINEGKKILTT